MVLPYLRQKESSITPMFWTSNNIRQDKAGKICLSVIILSGSNPFHGIWCVRRAKMRSFHAIIFDDIGRF